MDGKSRRRRAGGRGDEDGDEDGDEGRELMSAVRGRGVGQSARHILPSPPSSLTSYHHRRHAAIIMTLGPSPLGKSSSPPSSSTPAPSVIVHTVNVVRNIKPSQGGQVADAVHQTLHFALDGLEDDWAQPDDAEEEQRTPCGGTASSSSAPASTLTSASGIPIRRGFVPNPVTSQSQDRPYISYEYNSASHTLHLPHSAAIPDPLEIDPCGPQGREAHDVTAKMHLPALYGEGEGEVDEGKLVEEALQQLRQNTGLLTVDTLILAFEGLSTEGDKVVERDVERVRRVWQVSKQERATTRLQVMLTPTLCPAVPLALTLHPIPRPSRRARLLPRSSLSTQRPTFTAEGALSVPLAESHCFALLAACGQGRGKEADGVGSGVGRDGRRGAAFDSQSF